MLKAAKEGDEDRLGLGNRDGSWVMFLETSPISSRAVAEVDLHAAHKEVGLQPPIPPSRFFGGSYFAGVLRLVLPVRALKRWDTRGRVKEEAQEKRQAQSLDKLRKAWRWRMPFVIFGWHLKKTKKSI